MKLILVRHGRTIANEKGVLEDSNGKLSKLGKEQIKKLAIRLKNEKIDAIFSSPFLRAKKTALEIIKYHPSLKIKFTDKLAERDIGPHNKKRYEEFDWNNLPKDMETNESLSNRATEILKTVFSKHPKDTVLFVAHGGIIKALIKIIKNAKGNYETKLSLSNTGVSVFEITNDNNITHFIDCTKHLN